jgi:hypothetical protein
MSFIFSKSLNHATQLRELNLPEDMIESFSGSFNYDLMGRDINSKIPTKNEANSSLSDNIFYIE